MEGKGVRAVIMSMLILALVVAQIEAKSCCRNTTGRNCYNVCRVPGTPRQVCANVCGCQIITGTTCPNSHPRSSSTEASVYQTIITTTEFDEQDPSQSEMCRRQLSRMRMDNCKYYMFWPSSLLEQGCCKELERVNDPECRCEALRQRVPGYGQEQLQEAAMKVEGLADTCEMQELRSCQIRGQQEF